MKLNALWALALISSFSAVSFTAQAQDLNYARKVVNTIASSAYWGRGYTKDGMKKAADYIVSQLPAGVVPLDDKSFLQPFDMPINTFPGTMNVTLNGVRLVPGVDYIVSPGSRGAQLSGNLIQTDDSHFKDPSQPVIFTLEDKLTWSAEQRVEPTTTIELLKSRLQSIPESYQIDIENVMVPAFHAANVAVMVKGTVHPDRYVIMSAHYDHLGGMGPDTYFPGANDNASGTSMLLDLVHYYAAHPQHDSMVFLFFAAEEAGLVGSKYFVDHPMIDLSKIRFLMNLDLMGNGDQGATIVNATIFPDQFTMLQNVNAQGKFLSKIYPRGKAANSDHYWFSEKGVPAFFIYTMGGPPYYHDVMDRPESLLFSRYENVFRLLVGFNSKLMIGE